MLFITAIKNFSISEPLGRGFQIKEDYFLTNDKVLIKKKISKDAIGMMGTNEYLDLLEVGTAMYWEVESKDESTYVTKTKTSLDMWLFELRTFYQALWLVKDNSVNNELAFCFFEHPTHHQTACTSNFISPRLSNTRGKTTLVNFSLPELRQARDYFLQLFPLTFFEAVKDMQAEGKIPPAAVPFRSFKKPRLLRFHYFLSGARAYDDLPLKIALYMTCFEVLFSTTASELTHKLSERVAYFLGQNGPERKKIFETVKAAYAVRSKIVHGDEVEVTEKVLSTVVEIDDLLRRIFQRLLEDEEARKIFEKDKNALEEYLSNLTLGN